MIKLKFETLDGVREIREYKTLKGAQKWAQGMIGVAPTIGSSYAIGDWGDQKISVVGGTTLAELFPRAAWWG